MEQKQNLQIAISGPFEGSFQETVGGLRPLTPQMGECYYLDPADKFLQNLSSRGVPLLLVSTRRPPSMVMNSDSDSQMNSLCTFHEAHCIHSR